MDAKQESYFKPRTLTRGFAREYGVRNAVNADRHPKQQRRALDEARARHVIQQQGREKRKPIWVKQCDWACGCRETKLETTYECLQQLPLRELLRGCRSRECGSDLDPIQTAIQKNTLTSVPAIR
jgi:hypothetical protein